jgi:hypothetical protein
LVAECVAVVTPASDIVAMLQQQMRESRTRALFNLPPDEQAVSIETFRHIAGRT